MAQIVAGKKKVLEASIAEAAIAHEKEGQEVFAGHEAEDTGVIEEGTDLGTTSTQLK